MAERSSKLNEDTADKVDQTGALATTDVTGSDDVYLENRSTGVSASDTETNADADETSEETEQLRSQIEETRSNLGETIDAIQEKLSFSSISGQVKGEVSEYFQTAKDSVYDATIGKMGNIMKYVDKGLDEIGGTKVGVAARQNPLAVSLIGLGLGMLLINGFKTKRPNYSYNYDNDYDREDDYDDNRGTSYNRRELSSSSRSSTSKRRQDKGNSITGQVSNVAGQAYKGASDYAGQAYEGVSDAASKVGSTVTDAAGKVSDSVGNVASQAYRQVGNLGTRAKDVAGSAQDQYEHYMEENPLAVGAVALALGAAVGLSIPSTRVENHLMGEARENLVQKASDSAREAIDKVQQVAGEVKQSVQEKVKDSGLTQG